MPGTLGWREPPEYEWVPLADLSELEKAEIDASRGKAAGQALNDGWTDEDEVRERMSQVEWWGELKANWEPPVDEMEEKMKVAELEQMKAGPPRWQRQRWAAAQVTAAPERNEAPANAGAFPIDIP